MKNFVLTLMLVTVSGLIFAQSKIITGRVINSTTGLPVSDVTILVKGSRQGVSTNAEGTFSINVSPTAKTLIFSSIGFATQEVAIGNQSDLSVRLNSEEARLDEVVVVGYGTQRKKYMTAARFCNWWRCR